MKKVVIASNNAHKIDEIEHALEFTGWRFLSLREAGVESDPEEDGDTFEANARIKAIAAQRECGFAVLADDSGLEVDALDKAPGVYSSRYAGEQCDDAANNAKLLDALKGVPDERRTARFVCTLVFIDDNGLETVARGTVEGRIGHRIHGDNGFGYDPLFLPDAYEGSLSFAEISQESKNAISHRGAALRQLKSILSHR